MREIGGGSIALMRLVAAASALAAGRCRGKDPKTSDSTTDMERTFSLQLLVHPLLERSFWRFFYSSATQQFPIKFHAPPR